MIPSSLQRSAEVVSIHSCVGMILLGAVVGGACLAEAALAEDTGSPDLMRVVGSVKTPGRALGVAVSGNCGYVADDMAGLQVIDVADPTRPRIVGGVDTPGRALRVVVSGTCA